MDQVTDLHARLERFLADSAFRDSGAVMTDLDGTAVHEIEGRATVSRSVALGLEQVHAAGREVLVNTLRFPLSIMQAFGAEWLRASGAPMHAVSLKGSLVGRIERASQGALGFEELAACTLDAQEMGEILQGVRALVDRGVQDLLVFSYPRRWQEGERIWTPDAARLAHVARKFPSASRVFGGGMPALEEALLAQPHCMVFLLVDAPQDRLMAYQHTERERFFTHAGVDKRHGGRVLAQALSLSLPDSIGAGDADPDTFLRDVGLAVLVGRQDLSFRGRRDTVRVADAPAFGELLLALADALRAGPRAAVSGGTCRPAR